MPEAKPSNIRMDKIRIRRALYPIATKRRAFCAAQKRATASENKNPRPRLLFLIARHQTMRAGSFSSSPTGGLSRASGGSSIGTVGCSSGGTGTASSLLSERDGSISLLFRFVLPVSGEFTSGFEMFCIISGNFLSKFFRLENHFARFAPLHRALRALRLCGINYSQTLSSFRQKDFPQRRKARRGFRLRLQRLTFYFQTAS
jgi:hypothetical protein